jgi:hypothetical protein
MALVDLDLQDLGQAVVTEEHTQGLVGPAGVETFGFCASTAGRCEPPGRGQPLGGDQPGCVPDTKEHLNCAAGIAKALTKFVGAVTKCHAKQATTAFKVATGRTDTFDEEVCEELDASKSAKAKFDIALGNLRAKDICASNQIPLAQALETELLGTGAQSLDQQNGNIYCDGASDIDPGGDDLGKVPVNKDNLKCSETVQNNLRKVVRNVIKCHTQMADAFFGGESFDEEECEERDADPAHPKSALGKYNMAVDRLVAKAICPQCLDSPNQKALGASAVAQIDASNGILYPCP